MNCVYLLLIFLNLLYFGSTQEVISTSSSSSLVTGSNDGNSTALKCYLSGYNLPNSSLEYLFDASFKFTNHSANVFSFNRVENSVESYLICTNDVDEKEYCDIAIHIVKPSALFKEEELLSNIQNSIRSLLKGPNKKNIILLILSESKTIQQRVVYLLKEAYFLLENREEIVDEELFKDLDAKVLLLKSSDPTKMDPLVVKTVQNILNRFKSSTLRSYNNITFTSSAISKTSNLSDSRLDLRSYDICHEAIEEVIEWARKKASESVSELQKFEMASQFAGYVDNLISAGISLFDDLLKDAKPSKTVIEISKKEIRRRILTFLFPFYRVQTQLLRRTLSEEFNTVITDDESLTNSIYLESKLKQLSERLLSNYTASARRLIPRAVRSDPQWHIDTERWHLQEFLNACSLELVTQARVRGVLARSRRPVSVSLCTFIHHPFGRDHRQDVPGDRRRTTDNWEYDPRVNARSLRGVAVSAPRARAALRNYQKKIYPKRDPDIDKKSEFAREMLMFSLSIKNPQVPLMLGRSKKKTGPPKPERNREKTGPERYIYWDLPDMPPITTGEFVDEEWDGFSLKEKISRGLVKVLSMIPLFGDGYYEDPALRYGPEYGPYLPNSVRGKKSIIK